MFAYNTILVFIGAGLLGVGAGAVGVFAVLRRRALVGDTVAHAALPGLCLAFLVMGHRNLPAMLAGAWLSGMVGVGIVAALGRWTKIREDAALGVVLSVFFGAGIALDGWIQGRVTSASQAGLDSYILGKTAGILANDVLLLAGASAVCVAVLFLLHKEWAAATFDPAFAQSQGWPVFALDYLLMALVAMMVVIGLPAVGVVLMAAMLILPAASARFWTDRLDRLTLLASGFGLLIGVVGTMLSATFDHLPAGPIIVLVGGAAFCVSMLLAPKRGVVARWRQRLRFRHFLARRLLLGWLYECADASAAMRGIELATLHSAGSWPLDRLRRHLGDLKQRGLIEQAEADSIRLTAKGWRRAVAVVRADRLWIALLEEQPEQAALLRDLGQPSLAGLANEAKAAELKALLRSEGRWPKLPAGCSEETQA